MVLSIFANQPPFSFLIECKTLSSIARKSGGVVWMVWWLGAVTREEVQGGIPAYDSAPPRPRTTPAQQRAGNRENIITMHSGQRLY